MLRFDAKMFTPQQPQPFRAPPLPKHKVLSVFALLGIAASCLVPQPGLALDLEPCLLEAGNGRQQVRAQCGTVAAPLDPDDEDGATIDLFVAMIPANTPHKSPDPLTVIAGGPGDASTRFFALARGAFFRASQNRDVILVDQRGTGRSVPLRCPNLGSEMGRWDVVPEPEDAVREAIACLDAQDHDPRFFTTSVAVRDLDRVREAFGAETLNIYGISYGTRVAQHYLRRYPSRVRSVILDGVVPATVALGPDTALESQAVLDSVFRRCSTDPGCSDAFPNLEEHFHALLARLGEHPVSMNVRHPKTRQSIPVVISRPMVVGIVRFMLYAHYTTALLPSLIEQAYQGDYQPLVGQAILLGEDIGALAQGLNFAVVCTEDEPYWGDLDRAAQAATYMGTMFVDALQAACAAWPKGVMDDAFKEPIESDVPVLVIGGEFDPITPERYMPIAAAGLANHLIVRGKGRGHGLFADSCFAWLMAEFIDDPANPGALDTSCTGRLMPFPFFLSPLGPGP